MAEYHIMIHLRSSIIFNTLLRDCLSLSDFPRPVTNELRCHFLNVYNHPRLRNGGNQISLEGHFSSRFSVTVKIRYCVK